MAGRILVAALALTLTMATADQAVAQLKRPVSPAHLKAEAKILRALSAKGEVEFLDTPLEDAIEFVGNAWKVPVQIDVENLKADGIALDEPLTFRATGIPGRSLLALVLRDLGLTWTIQQGVLVITTEVDAEMMMDMRVYDVSDLVMRDGTREQTRVSLELMSDLIQTATLGPWEDIDGEGGLARILLTNKTESLAIKQRLDVHLRIGRLLKDLRAAQHEVLPETNADALPRPKPLRMEKSEQTLLKAMAKRVTVDFDNLELADAIERLGTKAGTQILIDETSLAKGGTSSAEPVTIKAARRSAGEILSELLKPLACDWTILHDAVYVTTTREAASFEMTWVYDVSDLVIHATAGGRIERDFRGLIERIQQEVRVPWQNIDGNGGRIAYFETPRINAIAIKHTLLAHAQTAALLAKLRAGAEEPGDSP